MDIQQLFSFSPHAPFYGQLLILLGTSTFLIMLMQRLRLSPMLGYMFAGILIGPSALGLIRDVHALQPVAELGIACLLFSIGLELSWARLKSMRHLVFGLGGLQVGITTMLIALIVWRLGQTPFAAALIGLAFALSSTAVVLQLLGERGAVTTRSGRAAFAVLLFQDLAAVPLLALSTAGMPDSDSMGGYAAIALAVLQALLALGGIILVARLLSQPLLRRVSHTRNNDLFVAFTLLVVLGMGLATQAIGLSLSFGAFLAGLLLSGTEYRHKIEADIAPFKGLLLGLFFMTVGMQLNLTLVADHFSVIIAALAVLTVLKGAVIFACSRWFRKTERSSLRIALWLAGAGEFALVAIQAMQISDLVSPETAQYMLAVAVFSLVLTPFLNKLDKLRESRRALLAGSPATLQGFQTSAHGLPRIVIAGYGRVGEAIASKLVSVGISYIAIDHDADRVSKAQSRGLPVYFGPADDLNLLHQLELGGRQSFIVTLDRAKDVTAAVTLARETWPNLPILARAYDPSHAQELQHAGANVTVTETMATSIALAEAAIVLSEDAEELRAPII